MNQYAQDIEFWIRVLTFLIAVGGIVYTFFSNRRKDVDEKVEGVEAKFEKRFEATEERLQTGSKRMDSHELQIQKLTQTVAVMPTKDDLHQVQMAIEKMAGNQKEMTAILSANRDFMTRLNTVLTRQEDFLLGKGAQ